MTKIFAVFKTHFDIGFTDLASDVVKNYAGKMADDVIKICTETQSLGKELEFKWTMSSWPLQKCLENMNGGRLLKFEELIRRGQILCHALPFTMHTEFLTKREITESLKITKELCAKYGRPAPVSAKMTDVPGHSAGLIEPMVKNGVKFLHLGCNPASFTPKVPLLFWWEDYDGNRLLTMYNRTYGAQVLPPRGGKFPVWLAMRMTNDNVGPPSISTIEELRAQTAGHEMSISTMDAFAEEIHKCDLSGLPVIKGELGDTWIHGVGTYPAEVSMLRRARRRLEALDTRGLLNEQSHGDDIKKYYDNAVLFGEHTWGMDVKTHLTWQRSYEKEKFNAERTEPRYKKIEKSWDEQRERARSCAGAVDNIEKKLGVKTELLPPLNENNGWKIEGAKIISPEGVEITPCFKYKIFNYDEICDFMRRYISRFYEWAVADFGRQSYPEINPGDYGYGAPENVSISCKKAEGGVIVTLAMKKPASPVVESGDFIFKTNIKNPEYYVDKMGSEINCRTDIVKGANSAIFCVKDYARISGIKIYTLDAPLISFGKSMIYKFNGGKFRNPKNADFVFNLFNNMWGTNFPQWTEGAFEFTFFVTEL